MGVVKKFIPKDSNSSTSKKKELDKKAPLQTAEKYEIEKIKQLLSEKIKNPTLAKKAALIISEMINSQKK